MLGDNPIFTLTVFVCLHDQATVVIMFYSFCFNKVPSKTFRMAYGDSCVDPAENQKFWSYRSMIIVQIITNCSVFIA